MTLDFLLFFFSRCIRSYPLIKMLPLRRSTQLNLSNMRQTVSTRHFYGTWMLAPPEATAGVGTKRENIFKKTFYLDFITVHH